MLRGEKWSHCTGVAAFFLPNAVKISKHVNVGQHSIILGFRECDTDQFLWKLQKESGFFFFPKQIPSWTRLQCHLPSLI